MISFLLIISVVILNPCIYPFSYFRIIRGELFSPFQLEERKMKDERKVMEYKLKMEIRHYVYDLLLEKEEQARFYRHLVLTTIDQLQSQQYERELRFIEDHIASLRLIFNFTRENG